MEETFDFLADLMKRIHDGMIEMSFLIMCCAIIIELAYIYDIRRSRKWIETTLLI